MAAGYGMAPEGHNNYDWYDMLAQYKKFKETYGRNPKSCGAPQEETRLYYWMYNQSRLILKGHMSKEHFQAIVDSGVDIPNMGNYLNGGKVSAEDQEWFQDFDIFRRDLRKRSFSEETLKWGHDQLKILRSGNMPPWRERKFKNIGITAQTLCFTCYEFEIRNLKRSHIDYNIDIWQKHALDYLDFTVKHGAPRHNAGRVVGGYISADPIKEKKLYAWREREVKAIKDGNRTELQIKALLMLGIEPKNRTRKTAA